LLLTEKDEQLTNIKWNMLETTAKDNSIKQR